MSTSKLFALARAGGLQEGTAEHGSMATTGVASPDLNGTARLASSRTLRHFGQCAVIVLSVVCAWMPAAAGAATGPPAGPTTPPFSQCPAVYAARSCQYLIDVVGSVATQTPTVYVDPSERFYDTQDDTLVGVQNDSSAPLSTVHVGVSGSGDRSFAFDRDGLCTPGKPPMPSGCPFGGTGDPFDYAGPGMSFDGGASTIPDADAGTVDFSPALQPGQYTYFSLEALPNNPVVAGNVNDFFATTLQNGSGHSSDAYGKLSAPSPADVTDTASLKGPNATSATGTVNYDVYSDSRCTVLVASAGRGVGTGGSGTFNPSQAVGSLLASDAIYYWQVSYSGDANNTPVVSACGSETMTFGSPPSPVPSALSGNFSANGASGPAISVASGTPVTAQAKITPGGTPGVTYAMATGWVTYAVYSDSVCKRQATSGVTVAVANGMVPPSRTLSLADGTYYLVVTYSGDTIHAPATTDCGHATVTLSAPPAPPAGSRVTLRNFSDHPTCPHDYVIDCGTFQAEVSDANGQPVDNANVHISISGPDAGQSHNDITRSNEGGLGYVSTTIDPGAAGHRPPGVTDTMTASIVDTNGATQTSHALTIHFVPLKIAHFFVGPWPAVNGNIANPDVPTSDAGLGVVTLTAVASDVYGNALTNFPVKWSVLTGGVDAGETGSGTSIRERVNNPVPGEYLEIGNSQNGQGGTGLDVVAAVAADDFGQIANQETPSYVTILWRLNVLPPPASQDKKDVGLQAAGAGIGFIGACAAGFVTPPPLDVAVLAFGCGGALASAAGTGIALRDPPDPHYKGIALPAASPPGDRGGCSGSQRTRCHRFGSEAVAFRRAENRVSVLNEAAAISINRSSGAQAAHDGIWEVAQNAATKLYLGEAVRAIRGRDLAGRALARWLSDHGRRITASRSSIGRAKRLLATLHGIPPSAVAQLIRRGMVPTRQALKDALRPVLEHVPNARVDFTAAFARPTAIGGLIRVADSLSVGEVDALMVGYRLQSAMSAATLLTAATDLHSVERACAKTARRSALAGFLKHAVKAVQPRYAAQLREASTILARTYVPRRPKRCTGP